jgi:hypothetical protein
VCVWQVIWGQQLGADLATHQSAEGMAFIAPGAEASLGRPEHGRASAAGLCRR